MPTKRDKLARILVIAICQPTTIFILMMFIALCGMIGFEIHNLLVIFNLI
jgi:hypothetical protein